jgi:hypothetical protein
MELAAASLFGKLNVGSSLACFHDLRPHDGVVAVEVQRLSIRETRYPTVSPMSKPNRNTRSLPLDDPLFTVKKRKTVPHEFVLEVTLFPSTRMDLIFGNSRYEGNLVPT